MTAARLPPDRESRWGYPERCCSICRDWWPASLEFFYAGGGRRPGALSRWCKACWAENKCRSRHPERKPCPAT